MRNTNSDRSLSWADKLIVQIDQGLRTLSPGASTAERPSPSKAIGETELSQLDKKHAASLMRINHTGEVCAQALYQGQAMTAKLPNIRQAMQTAAREEIDHLAWCEDRLQELDSQTSYLNPLWYAMSFGLGAIAGLAGDRWSLGFVAETEKQVCDHLQDHLTKLPEPDEKSKAILAQMLIDEKKHGDSARSAGGSELPLPLKKAMGLVSEVMKKTAYRI